MHQRYGQWLNFDLLHLNKASCSQIKSLSPVLPLPPHPHPRWLTHELTVSFMVQGVYLHRHSSLRGDRSYRNAGDEPRGASSVGERWPGHSKHSLSLFGTGRGMRRWPVWDHIWLFESMPCKSFCCFLNKSRLWAHLSVLGFLTPLANESQVCCALLWAEGLPSFHVGGLKLITDCGLFLYRKWTFKPISLTTKRKKWRKSTFLSII